MPLQIPFYGLRTGLPKERSRFRSDITTFPCSHLGDKIDAHTVSCYTGEPYNLSYYPGFFEKAGFEVCDRYKSNRFRAIEKDFLFTSAMKEIYQLIIRLYADFPVFQLIDEETFCENYRYLKYIIDYRMVKLAGFFISIPNYGGCLNGRMTLRKLLRALMIKRRPTDYVMLYMGVSPQHRGIGKALAEAVMRELQNTGAKSVGALIHEGKVTGDYFSELVETEYHYALFSCPLGGGEVKC
ncbi:MAG: hypothetical protein ACRDBO_16950 [Lachnospiraceae bacterium]